MLPVSMSEQPSITISPVIVAQVSDQSMRIPVSIATDRTIETRALVDSGAGGTFIDGAYAATQNIPVSPLLNPIPVFNVDGTPNQQGFITHCVRTNLVVAGISTRTRLLVTNLGNEHIILGLPWLRSTNAAVDWQSGEITLPGAAPLNSLPDQPTTLAELSSETEPPLPPTQLLDPDDEEDYGDPVLELEPDETLIAYLQGEPILGVFETETVPAIRDIPAPNNAPLPSPPTPGRISSRKSPGGPQRYVISRVITTARLNPAMAMAQQSHLGEKTRSFEDMVPEPYRQFKDVFEKKASERFPESRPYDHAIDLKPDFLPKNCKVYPLSPKEQAAMDEFIDDNLRKGYIRESKSPQASPFFFVSKKDGSL